MILGRQFWGHGLRRQGRLAEKVTCSLLCMVMDGVRPSLQVGGDLECSYEHAIVGMGLGHDGETLSKVHFLVSIVKGIYLGLKWWWGGG